MQQPSGITIRVHDPEHPDRILEVVPNSPEAKRIAALIMEKQNKPEKPGLRGLGDVVAAVTTAVGITPCGGCKERQAALNRAVPFRKPDA